MKLFNIKLLIIILATAVSVSKGQQTAKFNYLWKLYSQKELFKLNSAFVKNNDSLQDAERELIGGLIDRVFNKPKESNEKLDKVLNEYRSGFNDSVMMEIYDAKILNDVCLFNYINAVKTTNQLITDYGTLLDSADLEEYKNALVIWESSTELKPQTCVKSGDTKLKLIKDLAGLYNVKVTMNGIESEFIFDTGANFSTIAASLAKQMKLKFLSGKLKVGTATGIKVDAELAYTERMVIGNLSYNNVLFLVLPDEALSFAGGLYKIDGIIGFPVINEMKEINITSTSMYVPMVSKAKDTRNLCLYSFTPVVNVTRNNDSLIFVFDTGARKTSLFIKYYEQYKSLVDGKYEEEELEIEGAGGKKIIKGYILDNVILNAFGMKQKLSGIKLYSENFNNKDKYFYGNIGQDFFSDADMLTINFEYMYIEMINK